MSNRVWFWTFRVQSQIIFGHNFEITGHIGNHSKTTDQVSYWCLMETLLDATPKMPDLRGACRRDKRMKK